ncbi:hypothetical protein L0U85_19555 [Glycomyces sp. L485]|uniref:hypothetical protein n=1 Tax=Glycomyces sp. L485 TaxID=2909235 RepID=UPI001F4B5EDE|nr:hypothetical protein [Glycomyces sp. L485]MCH7233033.1 hypothetical protein [Glycomyces sp. L485]
MSKGFRVLLHIFQVLSLLAALLFMTFTFLMTYVDFGGTAYEVQFVGTWAIGFGILSVAFSPALWSLHRGGGAPSAAPQAMGSYDRAPVQPPAAPQLQQPGGVGFEPMGNDRAPAPPSSSYGQHSGPNFGAQPSGGMPPNSPPQGDSPWGSR